MKKLLLALGLCGAAALSASAQNKEVYVSYGGYTQMDAMDMARGMKTDNAWGAVNAGINFRVAPNLWIGPSYTFSSQTAKHDDDSHAYYHVIMLNGRYNYYRRGDFTMYAKAGIGVDISHISIDDGDYTKNKAYCAFQVNPIGAQYSLSRNFDLFGELGFGAQGLLQVGFKYKF
ncbi:MAG: porin family protein [Muribaculaceae bacterium]|nr:porin family protein [Muribaculaceae bacterium]